MMRSCRVLTLFPACLAAIALFGLAPVLVEAQGQQFQFFLSATDAGGNPVNDIKAAEVTMTENGMPVKILNAEHASVPVKLTITVDNGSESEQALAHYRTGLKALVEALPQEVEVTLLTTAPQPRTVVKSTSNREEILRGLNRFAPEGERPRFTDALVEYSRELEKDVKERKAADFVPVLVMVSTTANEVASYQVSEIEKAIGFLAARKAKVLVAMTVGRSNDVTAAADINTNRQALIAIPTTKATNGRFETMAVSSHLNELLPEFGRDIATLHRKHANQVRVTAQRPEGLSGPLQKLDVRITRAGVNLTAISGDGL